MQQENIKPLKTILHATPEAQAYWRELREGRQANAASADPVPEFDTPTCPVCRGYGFVRRDLPVSHLDFGKLFACPNPDCPTAAARREERYAKLSTLAQIPKEYQGDEVTFAGWVALEQLPDAMEGKRGALGAALAFVAARERAFKFTLEEAADLGGIEAPEFPSHPKCSLVFSGPNGIGKTSLAVSIARELIDDDVMVIYLRLAEFFDGLKDRFRDKPSYKFMPSAGDEAELLALLQEADVLVIDEFYPDVTDWRKERAEALINHRYTHQLPTIVTTNLDADTLTEKWGITTGHRIQAMAHWVEMGGMELRERAAKWVSP